MIKEDGAPTNSVAADGVAGITGDPPVSVKAQRKIQKRQKTTATPVIIRMLQRNAPNPIAEETFAGAVVFEVSSHTFHNAKMEKRKGKHWRTYLDECDELTDIREYANRHPNKPIVLQNRNTNEMVYVRYGKGR